MSPLLVIAISLALTLIGIALISFHIVHDQPEYSLEKDTANKLAAERQANSRYFFLQRARILKRQKRIGQYGWLILAVFMRPPGGFKGHHRVETNQRDSDIGRGR